MLTRIYTVSVDYFCFVGGFMLIATIVLSLISLLYAAISYSLVLDRSTGTP